MMSPRIAVERQEIADVVETFYQRVRQDSVLGPIFAAHVKDWPAHEEKITRFWANTILFERSYDGNPMRVHLQAGNVQADHFIRWLDLFDDTLRDQLQPEQSQQWSQLAHRIGRGLSMGIKEHCRPADTVPDLTARL